MRPQPSTSSLPQPPGSSDGDQLSQLGSRLHFHRNEEIFLQEDEADYVYRVVSGVVRTTRLSADGRRQIGGFYYVGDVVGLGDGETYSFSAEALTPCALFAIPRRALEAGADRDPGLARELRCAAQRELRRMQGHLLQIGRKSALERVAAVLADLAAHGDGAEVDIPMSRQDLADYLSLTIETVSRMLTQLQASRVIRLVGLRRLTIADPRLLQQLAA